MMYVLNLLRDKSTSDFVWALYAAAAVMKLS